MRSIFASLAVADFRHLFIGTFAGHVGFWMGMVAQGWLAFQLTESATFLGLMYAASALPGVVFMLPSGVLADRWDRRAMVVYSNALWALASLALTILVAFDLIQPWQLVVFSVLAGLAAAINIPARQALGPQLVGPSLTSNAVALSSLSFNASRVLGPAAAGALIAAAGLLGCFVAQTILLFASALLTALMRAGSSVSVAQRRQSAGQNLVDGLRYAATQPVLRGCILVSTMHNLAGMIYLNLMPVFAGSVLDVGGAGLGALMTAVGVGSAIGAVAAVSLSGHPRKGAIMYGMSMVWGATIMAFAASQSLPVALGALLALGCTHALAAIANHTILNLAVPEEYRGRVNSIFVLTWNIAPLAALPAGAVADRIGASLTVGGSGALTILLMLALFPALAAVRGFRDQDYLEGRQVGAAPSTSTAEATAQAASALQQPIR